MTHRNPLVVGADGLPQNLQSGDVLNIPASAPIISVFQTAAQITFSHFSANTYAEGASSPVDSAANRFASLTLSAGSATQQVKLSGTISWYVGALGDQLHFAFFDGTTCISVFGSYTSAANLLDVREFTYIYTPGDTAPHTYRLEVFPGPNYTVSVNGSGSIAGSKAWSAFSAQLINS